MSSINNICRTAVHIENEMLNRNKLYFGTTKTVYNKKYTINILSALLPKKYAIQSRIKNFYVTLIIILSNVPSQKNFRDIVSFPFHYMQILSYLLTIFMQTYKLHSPSSIIFSNVKVWFIIKWLTVTNVNQNVIQISYVITKKRC